MKLCYLFFRVRRDDAQPFHVTGFHYKRNRPSWWRGLDVCFKVLKPNEWSRNQFFHLRARLGLASDLKSARHHFIVQQLSEITTRYGLPFRPLWFDEVVSFASEWRLSLKFIKMTNLRELWLFLLIIRLRYNLVFLKKIEKRSSFKSLVNFT